LAFQRQEAVMTDREFFVHQRKSEFPIFQRILKAIPKDKIHYKPHERSPTAEQLVWTITGELKGASTLIETGKLEPKHAPAPPVDQMIAMFDQFYSELVDHTSKMSDAAWTKKASFIVNGRQVMEAPTSALLWLLFFDAVHHRGQLSAYIRPMGGKVPSIYGPSADDPGGM
jgi:uncharacterized damage-inducible protein DinB